MPKNDVFAVYRYDAADCYSYGPGHVMHWIAWKRLADYEPVPVISASVDEVCVTLTLEDGRVLTWWHHEVRKLAKVARHPQRAVVYRDRGVIALSKKNGKAQHLINCARSAEGFSPCWTRFRRMHGEPHPAERPGAAR